MTAKPTQFDISSTFSQLVTDFNTVSLDLGGTGRLTTTIDSDAVGAINELDAELGTITAGAMGTSASTVSGAIAELHTEVTSATSNIATLNTNIGTINAGNLGTSASTVVPAIKEVHDEVTTATSNISSISTSIGTVSAGNMGTTASTVVTAISELEVEIDTLQTNIGTVTAGNMGTSASTVVTAIRELEEEIDTINTSGAASNNTLVGSLGALTTNQDSDVVGAINELEVGIRGTSNNLVATDLTTSANDLVAAINEIEAVFDASAKGISAGASAFDIASGAFSVDASGAITLDATGDVVLKDAGVVFSTLVNSSGNLILKSGTTTSLTFSGANVTMAGTITPSVSLTTTATTVAAAINELKASVPIVYNAAGSALN